MWHDERINATKLWKLHKLFSSHVPKREKIDDWILFDGRDTLRDFKNFIHKLMFINMKSIENFSLENLIEFPLKTFPLCAKMWNRFFCLITYPASPPLSILFASVTSSLHTSNCHFRKPRTPQRTLPLCTPILISMLLPVASRTILKRIKKRYSKMNVLQSTEMEFKLALQLREFHLNVNVALQNLLTRMKTKGWWNINFLNFLKSLKSFFCSRNFNPGFKY